MATSTCMYSDAKCVVPLQLSPADYALVYFVIAAIVCITIYYWKESGKPTPRRRSSADESRREGTYRKIGRL